MKLIDILFRSQIFGIPVAALWIVAGGCLAAVLQQCGVDPTAYKIAGLVGLLIGIFSVVYSVAVDNREKKAREDAQKQQLLKS